jgi:hypothetical protein
MHADFRGWRLLPSLWRCGSVAGDKLSQFLTWISSEGDEGMLEMLEIIETG